MGSRVFGPRAFRFPVFFLLAIFFWGTAFPGTGASAVSGRLNARTAPHSDVRFRFDRADRLYHVGETAEMTITVYAENGEPAQSGMLYVRITHDGGETLGWHEIDLSAENPVSIGVSLSFPGHVLVKTTACGEEIGKELNRSAGLSFDPEKIEPALPMPGDFERFWEEGKAEVRAIPIDAEIVQLDGFCDGAREVSQVSFATIGGERVYGFLSKPAGSGPFPALVTVPGAGPGTGPDLAGPAEGFAVLVMNVFPYPVPIDPKERQDVHTQFNESLGKRYCYVNSDCRETYFYRSACLGIDRAIDWFAEQPFVDQNRIGFVGTSQGGALALVLTGLNKKIKAAVASVPALCDHGGSLKGRSPGWPRLYAESGDNPAVLEASRYLDAVNFARSIDVPIRVTVGFIDETCPPGSVWSAYNVIPSRDKQILFELELGHQNGTQYEKAYRWLLDTVRNRTGN